MHGAGKAKHSSIQQDTTLAELFNGLCCLACGYTRECILYKHHAMAKTSDMVQTLPYMPWKYCKLKKVSVSCHHPKREKENKPRAPFTETDLGIKS